MPKIDLKQFVIPVLIDNTNEYGSSNPSYCTKDYVFIEATSSFLNQKLFDKKASATDFAVANGVSLNSLNDYVNKRSACRTLRSAGNKINQVKAIFTDGGNIFRPVEKNAQYGICPMLHLDLNSVLETKKQYDLFKIGEIRRGVGKKKLHTISFGEFPSHFVGDELNEELNNNASLLKDTGRTFYGPLSNDGKNIKVYNEKVYNGQTYVNVECNPYDKNSYFEDGTPLPAKGNKLWFKVEPIIWIIRNWDDMPKEINPNGNGKALFIDVRTAEVITAGLTFNTQTGTYNNLWQNSIIRTYLNSLDLKKDISKNRRAHKPENFFNFEGRGFLEEALIISIEKTIEPKKETTNNYEVTIDESDFSIKDQMKFYIDNGLSFMLHGPSGVGKTKRIKELDPNVIILQLRNGILPEEITGKTAFNDLTGKSTWIEPTWYTKLCEICKNDPEHNHVLFIDEITNVKEIEQSLVFNLVLEHSIEGGKGKLPNNCVVVAAGNTPEESSAAYNMPEPLFRRFNGHIELKPDIVSWLEWGSEKNKDGRLNIHPYVASFVAHFQDELFYTKYDNDNPPKFAIDPRGWEQVSNIIYENNGAIRQKMIADKIGEEYAKKFLEFAKTPTISLKQILNESYQEGNLPKTESDKYALIYSLRYIDENQLKQVRNFILTEFGKSFLCQFDNIWVNNDQHKKQLVLNHNKEIFTVIDDQANQML